MFGGGETLEEALLTANVPGRYSKWDKGEASDMRDEDERSCCSDAEQQEEEPDGYNSQEEDPAMKAINDKREAEEEVVPEGIREAIKRGERPGAKTGVKGVLADYKAFKQAAYDQKQKEKSMRAAILKRMAEGSVEKQPGASEQDVLAALQQRLSGAWEKEEEEDEDDDDDFLEAYRRKRLQELKSSACLPVFGEIQEVTAFEFVDALDKTDPRVKVVVHLYEPYVRACSTLNKFLEGLGRKHTHTRFLRLRASATRQAVDEVALPMLVVYQGGKVVETLARVHEEFADSFTQDDVEWLLENRGLLSAADVEAVRGTEQPRSGSSSVAAMSRMRMDREDTD